VLISPKIMGKVTGLNPAVILLSLSIWGSLMGMVGMIIALPMTTLIISYYKRFVLKKIISDPVEQTDFKVELSNKEIDL
ncbi:MAG TPA: AI-2E family transporter, partial [Paludibacter sp.]